MRQPVQKLRGFPKTAGLSAVPQARRHAVAEVYGPSGALRPTVVQSPAVPEACRLDVRMRALVQARPIHVCPAEQKR